MPDDVREALEWTFTDPEAARAWLDRPNPHLHGQTPRQKIANGNPERVLAVLEALNSGFAS